MKEILNKCFSGKYFLTLCAGTAFLYATVKGTLPAEAVASIISVVVMAYFSKKDEKNGGEQK